MLDMDGSYGFHMDFHMDCQDFSTILTVHMDFHMDFPTYRQDIVTFIWMFRWIVKIYYQDMDFPMDFPHLLCHFQVTVPWSGSTPATSPRCRARRRRSARWRPAWIGGTDAWGTTSIRALQDLELGTRETMGSGWW